MNSNHDDDDDDEDDNNDDDGYDKCRYSNQETVAESCIPRGCFKMAQTLDLYKERHDRILRLLRENVTKVYCKVRI